ncbi:helix-turn-helix transcriptional regulator [Rhizobium sp. B209b/85]
MPEFITIAELAKTIRATPQTVYNLINRHAAPKITKIGGKTLFERTDVDAWLAASKTDTVSRSAAR